MGDPPVWEYGDVLSTLHRKNWLCYEARALASDLDLSYEKGT
jgi:hypothetical protein